MTPAQADLARKLAASPSFPIPAERHHTHGEPIRYGRIAPDGNMDAYRDPATGIRMVWTEVHEKHPGYLLVGLWLPDLTDDATAGVLLGMLWRADPDAGWHAHGPPGLICVHNADRSREFCGDTLGEAVAGALIAVGRAS